MADTSDSHITFKCSTCGHPVVIEKDKPPNDNDIISCHGCGHQFGTYAQVREAAIGLAKAELSKMIEDAFIGIPGVTITKS